jgi:chromosome segregation ATPase
VVKENDFSNNNSYLKPQSNFQVNVVPSISSNRIVNSGLIKRIKEVTVQSSAESLLKGYFEKAFTSSLEEMTGLLNIKTKTKWDIKDKLKKQEAAIKESKDLTITHFNELNDLKLNCINHDSRVNAILNDCIDSLQEKDLQIENLIIQESTFNSKLSSITDKLTETERLLEQSLKDQEPCNRENIKMKAELKELTRTMNDLEVSLSETKLQNSRLEEEMRTSTVSFDVKLSTQKDQYDKVYN